MQIDKVSTQVTKQKRQYNAEKNVYTVNDDFALINFAFSASDCRTIATNVKAAIMQSNTSIVSFFRQLNKLGVKTKRENFMYKELRFFPSILWVGTFARCLGLQTHQLLDPSLPDKLATGEVTVKIQFLPEQTGNK